MSGAFGIAVCIDDLSHCRGDTSCQCTLVIHDRTSVVVGRSLVPFGFHERFDHFPSYIVVRDLDVAAIFSRGFCFLFILSEQPFHGRRDFIGGKTSASAYGVHGAQPGIGRRDKEAFGIRTVEHIETSVGSDEIIRGCCSTSVRYGFKCGLRFHRA